MNISSSPASVADDRWLSPRNQDIRRLVASSGSARLISFAEPGMIDFMHTYKYPVCSYPTCVSSQYIDRHFAEAARSIPAILYRSIRSRFGKDSQAFSGFTGWPSRMYDVLRYQAPALSEIICRFDAILSPQGMKVLEVNCGSSCGGWQLDPLEAQTVKLLARFPEIAHSNLRFRKIFEGMVNVLTTSITGRRPSARGNTLLFNFMGKTVPDEVLQADLSPLYDRYKMPKFPSGRLLVFHGFEQLSFSSGGDLMYRGMSIDALMLAYDEHVPVPASMYDRLNGLYLTGRLYFPDSPFHLVIGSKRMLALAHECCDQGLLSREDSETIRRYIPWTGRLEAAETTYGSSGRTVADLLMEKRASYIIKKGDSSGGRDVVVGHYTTDAAWRRAVEVAAAEGGWVAQEFCKPQCIEVENEVGRKELQQLVWGIFSLAGSYGGAFVRARPFAEFDTGVVNSANGAIEHLVMEDWG